MLKMRAGGEAGREQLMLMMLDPQLIGCVPGPAKDPQLMLMMRTFPGPRCSYRTSFLSAGQPGYVERFAKNIVFTAASRVFGSAQRPKSAKAAEICW